MISRLFSALAFLTIVPVPAPARAGSDNTLEKSLVFFPVIGAGIGLFALGCGYFLMAIFPQPVAAVLLCTVLLGVSGGLHMDGLADTADGFFSSRPRERILEIMRDSHVGAMGVIAIILILLLKTAALATCTVKGFFACAFLMPLAGRTAILLMMAILPYARPEGGLGALFYTGPVKRTAAVAFFLFFLAAWAMAGKAGFAIGGIVLVVILLFSWFCRVKIHGATGDTLGAVCELAEGAVALAVAAEPVALLLG